MMHDGSDWNMGFGFGHWGFGILFWAIIILAIVALVKYVFTSNK